MRHRIALLALLPALCALAPAAGAQKLDIVDLYREMQVARGAGFPTYEITETNGKATASGGILYGPRARITLTLDRPRFYLRIDDRGDDDGASAFITEFVMWLDREGFPLVGLSERGLKGGVPFAGRVRFYSRASGRWNLVTGEVFPTPDETVCGTAHEEIDESTSAWEGLGRAVAVLPRAGTDIAVWCVGPSPKAGTGALVEWDRANGRFRNGKALDGPPPWPDVPPPAR
ncbi:hypothetical protein [Xanthobacter pseudotagetidis]|uniref:hypothetical protein n=1 Tax=Xanthobacter pseudotagetidis TaxID=3119911 RepID=UPI003729589F